MAVKASALITLSSVTDVASVTRYYLLQSSTLSRPSKPTAKPPTGGWTDTEPTYTAGSTNSLYFTDLTVFSDGTWNYSSVSLSSSYEASKAAYNKATQAQATAASAVTTANDVQTLFMTEDVLSVDTYYLISKQKKVANIPAIGAAQWTLEPQTPTKKLKYLWIYYAYHMRDGSVTYSVRSRNGTAGLTINEDDTEMEYCLSSTADAFTQSGQWSETLPAWSAGRYTWCRLRIAVAGESGYRYGEMRACPEFDVDSGVESLNDACFDAVDGIGTVYIQATQPTGASVNDVWCSTVQQKVYRAVQGAAGTLTWRDITSKGIARAIMKAAEAANMADSKMRTYCMSDIAPVTATSEIDDPASGDICMVTSGSSYHQYIYGGSAWALHDVGGDVCMININDVVTLWQCNGSSWSRADVDLGDLWLDAGDLNKVYRWNGTSWALTGSELDKLASQVEAVQDEADRQKTVVESVKNLPQYVEHDSAGLHLRSVSDDPTKQSELLLTSVGMQISLEADGEQHYTEYGVDYTRHGNFKQRITKEGGMAFIYGEYM